MQTRLIVRVWTSEENREYPGTGVGHISLETKDAYMSLWPIYFTPAQIEEYHEADNIQRKNLKYFMERKADFHQNYEEDVTAENNIEPQVVICLYNLDIYMIENEFEKMKKNTTGWRLVGSNLFVQQVENIARTATLNYKLFESNIGGRTVDSCASLALKLLKAGEISKYVDTTAYSSFLLRTSSVVKPDDILKIIIPAKLTELETHPETQDFYFQGETTLSRPVQKSCLIL